MNEASLWALLKKNMSDTGWHVTRVESSAGNGYPDVSYGIPGINGFIELKYIKEWPVRGTTKVKLPLRPEQKLWIKQRGELSGNVWVFIRIADDFFLLDWRTALWLAEEGAVWITWIDSETTIPHNWAKRVDWEQFCQILKGGC